MPAEKRLIYQHKCRALGLAMCPAITLATCRCFDLNDGACHVIGEYQSIGASQNGDDSGPIVAAWADLRRSCRWHRALTRSQTCPQRVLILNRVRWRLAAEITDPTFMNVRFWHKADICLCAVNVRF
jgi:hypothetical protein